MNALRVTCVVGARPNFVKIAALLHEMGKRPHCAVQLIHTGQHFSPDMSQVIFDDLEIRDPDIHLGIAAGTQTQQTAEMMLKLETVFADQPPDVLLVVGDVTSTLAASLVAAKLGIRIAHVEAGLRSFDRNMPEEINRLITDAVADYLFVTEQSGVDNLRREGVADAKVFLVGNTMIDTLLRFLHKTENSDVIARLHLQPKRYVVVTLHRPSNVDDPGRLTAMLAILVEIAERLPVVFPVHPRTRSRLDVQKLADRGVLITAPLGYIDFLTLTRHARVVMTDSGGIQEETTCLGIPCLTLRENTERPITVEQGTNRLVGVDAEHIRTEALRAIDNPNAQTRRPALWDGKAAMRIIDVLEQKVLRLNAVGSGQGLRAY
jgi:UDP-N-acetylglucosamine 2-epimerase (non-hydrolysing)